MSGGLPPSQFDDDDAVKEAGLTASTRGKDFECPSCSANNPYDDGFGAGDEIRCFYCGAEYKVELKDDGRFKFREV